MFVDLLNSDIKPNGIDVLHLPDIKISDELKSQLHEMLYREEGGYVQVSEWSTVVQVARNKNFVFFSHQWLYLAVKCKRYAEALKPYCDFFDDRVRGNDELLELFKHKRYDSMLLKNLINDDVDRDRFIKYVEGGNDNSVFRPGKNQFDQSSVRTVKDVFVSCVLKQLPVPDASSTYLGVLIYYLAKRPELYNEVESEILRQVEQLEDTFKLPSAYVECAKSIVDRIYSIDKLSRLTDQLTVNESSIKINTDDDRIGLPKGRLLRYMFGRPSSANYNSLDRHFQDEYTLEIDNNSYVCKLSKDWKGDVTRDNQDGNFVEALVNIVNIYYSDVFEIKKESGIYFCCLKKTVFSLDELPQVFDSEYSRRYITSLLAKPFVILTGNSGTGKTRISEQFAEYLRTDENNSLILPVGADWTDNTKMLGFYNPLANGGKGKYEKTQVLELIERANDNPEKPFFLILDEMNLSHVERYFSDFLSHMEIAESPIKLDGYRRNENDEIISGEIGYPDNLFVVGTVNVDETTYMFSPKVLDRANVIEFKPNKKDVLNLFKTSRENEKILPAKQGIAEAFFLLAKEIRFKNTVLDESDISDAESIFDSVYDVTEKYGYEFAYRTVKEIRQYLYASYKLSENWSKRDLYRAVDEQIVQKILPKIHGNKKEIGSMLDELEMICMTEGKELKLSARKIELMKGRLAAVQYASFV